jgi:hypothetical protein
MTNYNSNDFTEKFGITKDHLVVLSVPTPVTI